ncbi:uncharacterized protein LOC127443547 [Myxocyprinus asiaticus]|uniref:uncharacterized protein LOC127443547 n=1 Tax=Myxocyprinus asiaticus TaxID=70543 RepID=UPI002222FFCB|nr:uncharacterized protein LOC127443547 [Myxocyprinus asiaticus]
MQEEDFHIFLDHFKNTKLQPLDRSVYGPFKKLINTASDAWMRMNPGKTMTIYDIPSLECDYAPSQVTDRPEPSASLASTSADQPAQDSTSAEAAQASFSVDQAGQAFSQTQPDCSTQAAQKGCEQFHGMGSMYCHVAAAIILTYGVTNWQSFVELEDSFLSLTDSTNSDSIFAIVGNKADLTDLWAQVVTPVRALEGTRPQAEKMCFKTSAKTGYNVDVLFETLFDLVLPSIIQKHSQNESPALCLEDYNEEDKRKGEYLLMNGFIYIALWTLLQNCLQ